MAYQVAFEYIAAKDGETKNQGTVVFESDIKEFVPKTAKLLTGMLAKAMEVKNIALTLTEVDPPEDLSGFVRRRLPTGDSVLVQSDSETWSHSLSDMFVLTMSIFIFGLKFRGVLDKINGEKTGTAPPQFGDSFFSIEEIGDIALSALESSDPTAPVEEQPAAEAPQE